MRRWVLGLILTSGCSASANDDRGGTDANDRDAEAFADAEVLRIVAGQRAYATAETDWSTAFVDANSTALHRMSCSFALARAIELREKGETMSRTDPAFLRLHASALGGSTTVWTVGGEDWIKPVPAAQCLLAARVVDQVLAPSDRLTQGERDVVYGGAAALTSSLWTA